MLLLCFVELSICLPQSKKKNTGMTTYVRRKTPELYLTCNTKSTHNSVSSIFKSSRNNNNIYCDTCLKGMLQYIRT